MPGCFQLPPLSTSKSYSNCGECFLHRRGVKPNFAGSLGFMAKESFVEQPLVLTHILQSDFLLLVLYSMKLRPFLFSFLLFLFQSFLLFKMNLFFFFFPLSLQNLKGFFLSTGISTINIFLPAVIRLPLQPINPGHVLFVDQF